MVWSLPTAQTMRVCGYTESSDEISNERCCTFRPRFKWADGSGLAWGSSPHHGGPSYRVNSRMDAAGARHLRRDVA
jgi:hypothetical protein